LKRFPLDNRTQIIHCSQGLFRRRDWRRLFAAPEAQRDQQGQAEKAEKADRKFVLLKVH
jgi:hypothetical protein